jgi:Na+-driven multidrug efflux pump
MITILFDSVYMWVVVMPVCLILSRLKGMNIHWLFALCQGCEVIKLVFGVILLRRGTWVRQLVGDESLKR